LVEFGNTIAGTANTVPDSITGSPIRFLDVAFTGKPTTHLLTAKEDGLLSAMFDAPGNTQDTWIHYSATYIQDSEVEELNPTSNKQ